MKKTVAWLCHPLYSLGLSDQMLIGWANTIRVRVARACSFPWSSVNSMVVGAHPRGSGHAEIGLTTRIVRNTGKIEQFNRLNPVRVTEPMTSC